MYTSTSRTASQTRAASCMVQPVLASATSTSPGSSYGRTGVDARDVGLGLAADLELELAVALGPVAGDLGRHRSGRLLGDRTVEGKASP